MNKYNVVINTLIFEVIEVDDIGETKEGGVILGHTDYIKQTISLLKSLSNEQKINTLRHELTHAYLWAFGFSSMYEEVSLEVVCDFVGIYSEDIVRIANEYMKEVHKYED